MRTAIYAGSFDPITRGHEDLIMRSLEFVDRLIVAVAINSSKQPLFTIEERVELIRATVGAKFGVKASGGIRDTATALAMIEAGANRLGCSNSIAIIEGLKTLAIPAT